MKTWLLLSLSIAAACGGDFARTGPNAHLVVVRTAGDPGTPTTRLPLSFTQSTTFTLHVQAVKADGSIDTGFNGFVRASIKPGTVVGVTGPNTSGRNVQLVNGVADGVQVQVIAAYGDARIWFEDVGYVPSDPNGARKPQCADGIDNNGNGLVDFPADPGCAFANDDTEDGGTFGTGTTEVLFFAQPRIADVRGITLGGNGTPLPHDQVAFDTGWRSGGTYAFSTVVTRVAADGFYVTDLQDDTADPTKRAGFGSIFAFTYSTPPLMRVCDRLKVFAGTSSDFFGFTEVGFPTWLVEEWDPSQRPCLVPEPTLLSATQYQDTATMFKAESALVRIQADGPIGIHVVQKLGPDFPQKANAFAPSPTATNCDFNKNGKIDFTGGDEQACSTACDSDPECSEYSALAAQGDFKVIMTDASQTPPTAAKVEVNASSAAQFDPLSRKGQPIKAFTGTVRYFSGGSQFTIQARCDDDIIVDPNGAPQSSSTACVHARTVFDNQN